MTTTTYPTLNQPVSPPAENSLAHAGSGTDKLRQEKWRIRIGRILFAIGLIAVWELGSRYVFDPFWSGQPTLVADRLITMVSNGDLWWHLVPTVIQALAGLLLSLLVGVPLGILFAINKTVEKIIEPFFLGLYSVPRVALAPLFILWFGIGPASKIVMAFSLVVFIVILNTYEGIRGVDKDLIDMLRAMRASHLYILRKVIFPGIVPWIFASVRVGVGLALVGSVVGELLGSNRGLGWYIEHAAARIDVIGVFSGLVALMIVGMLLNEIVKAFELRLLRERYAS